jgi:hypothetical protein
MTAATNISIVALVIAALAIIVSAVVAYDIAPTPGPLGHQGTAGTNGTAGPPGPNGFNGSAGLNGTAGTNGVNGVNGQNGSQGPPGLNGRNGTNASVTYANFTVNWTLTGSHANQTLVNGTSCLYAGDGAYECSITLYNNATEHNRCEYVTNAIFNGSGYYFISTNPMNIASIQIDRGHSFAYGFWFEVTQSTGTAVAGVTLQIT